MQIRLKKYFLLVLLALVSIVSNAGVTSLVDFKPKTDIVVGAKISVVEPDGMFSPTHALIKRENIVRLVYSRDDRSDVLANGSWTYTVVYKIYSLSNPGSSVQASLLVSFSNNQPVYEDINVHFGAYVDAEIEILSVTPSNASVPDDIYLELETKTTRQYGLDFDNSSGPNCGAMLDAMIVDVSPGGNLYGSIGGPLGTFWTEVKNAIDNSEIQFFNSTTGNLITSLLIIRNPSLFENQWIEILLAFHPDYSQYLYCLNFSNAVGPPDFIFNSTDHTAYWSFMLGAEEYDLEYVFIDAKDQGIFSTVKEGPFKYKEPTRINTTKSSYQMDMVYPEGDIYFRVRPAGRFITNVGNNYSHLKLGSWTYTGKYTISTAFEKDHNWNYSNTFAEEGKHKSVISYFDGNSRNRQQQTNLSTNGVSSVRETKYDHEGRSVVNILPAPKQQNDLAYSTEFNKNSTNTESFEKEFFDMGTHQKMTSATGVSQYYSSDNPFTNEMYRDFIPQANGFAYEQIEYTRDHTERIARSSEIGGEHKLRDITNGAPETKETQFFYGTPNSTELHQMFGSNAGVASHYIKNMRIDVNGQISLSYLTQGGKTIATSLAGESPDNLTPLASNSPNPITVNLNDNNIIDNENHTSINSSSILNVTQNTNYNFSYDLIGVIYQTALEGPGGVPVLCIDCVYDLEISIVDPCGVPVPLTLGTVPNGVILANDIITYTYSSPGAPTCPASYHPGIINFSTPFADLGNYTVTKKITINGDNIDAHLQIALNQAGLGQNHLNNLITQYQNEIDWSLCDVTCTEHCTSTVLSSFPGLDVSNPAQFAIELDNCIDALCQGEINGIVKDIKFNNGECEAILQSMIADLSLGGDLYLGVPIDLDNMDNATLQIYLSINHPGYCHYTLCQLLSGSKAYDVEQALINDWGAAMAAGYDDPLNNPKKDPFITFLQFNNTALHLLFLAKISTTNYVYIDQNGAPQPSGLTIEQFADYNNYNNITSPLYMDPQSPGVRITLTSVEQSIYKWKFYRGIYQQIKMQTLLDHYATVSCSYDDISVLDEPQIITDYNQFLITLDNGLNNLNNASTDCDDICANNVQYWMSKLSLSCGPLSQADFLELETALSNYCSATCGLENPFGAIIDNGIIALGTPFADLHAVFFNSSSGCNLNTLITNPYLNCENVIVNNETYIYFDPCTQVFLDYINNEILPISSPLSNIFYQYDPNIFPQYASCMPLPRTILVAGNDFRDWASDGSCGFPIYSGPGVKINVKEIELIFDLEPALFDPGYVSAIVTAKVKVKMKPTFGGNTVEAFIYGCFDTPITGTININACVPTDFNFTNTPVEPVSCDDWLLAQAEYNATQQYQDEVDAFSSQFIAEYFQNCFDDPFAENFQYNYISNEYHYMLYYYDQADNLLQTVPPQGVNLLDASDVTIFGDGSVVTGIYDGTTMPPHTFETRYAYNRFNQLRKLETPDAGITDYLYNDKGQLLYSQNAKQLANGVAGYTIYDNIGRTIEVGQNVVASGGIDINSNTPAAGGTEVIQTHYDNQFISSIQPHFKMEQQNLRNRISSVASFDNFSNSNAYNTAIHYSYDAHGNINELLQEDRTLSNISGSVYKKIDYDYDLINGNVNKISYQEGKVDQFYHLYCYDADNRITNVETSTNGYIWENDASYFYYLHGPLARTEVGEDKIQGTDYAYNLKGWLKGINSNTLNEARDIGQDGRLNNPNSLNSFIAGDVYGYSLNYFENDYTSIVNLGANSFLATTTATPLTASLHTNLYNGNISHMVTALLDENENPKDIMGYAYKYDQLNRIKQMDAFTGNNIAINNTFAGTSIQNGGDYNTSYSYDKNGNIASLFRNGESGNQMDDMLYKYYDQNGVAQDIFGYDASVPTNKLSYVVEQFAGSIYNDDIEGMNTNNYEYDKIGNLTKDMSEDIEDIEWTVYGKVKKITRTAANLSNSPDIEFAYDPLGSRTLKIVKPNNSTQADWVYHYYKTAASGTIMANYTNRFVNIAPNLYKSISELVEMPIYGKVRLGVNNIKKIIKETTFSAAIDANGMFDFNPLITFPTFRTSGSFQADDLTFSSLDGSSLNLIVTPVNYATLTATTAVVDVIIDGETLSGDYIVIPAGKTVQVLSAGDVKIQSTERFYFESDNEITLKVIGNLVEFPAPKLTLFNSYSRELDHKQYEFTNHLGNVMSVVNDRKIGVSTNLANTSLNFGFEPNDPNVLTDSRHLAMISTTAGTFHNGSNSILQDNATHEFGPQVKFKVHSGDVVVSAKIWGKTLNTNTATGGIFKKCLVNTAGEFLYLDQAATIEVWDPQSGSFLNTWVERGFTNYPIPAILYDKNGNIADPEDIYLWFFTWMPLGHGPTYFDDISIVMNWQTTETSYSADVQSYSDYYPFGQLMPSRWSGTDYRYGFQNQEQDDEAKGHGNSINYKSRMHDPRLGRFFAIDPLTMRYPFYSPYAFSGNRVIDRIELDGLEPIKPISLTNDLEWYYPEGATWTFYTQENGELVKVSSSKAVLWEYDWAWGKGTNAYPHLYNKTWIEYKGEVYDATGLAEGATYEDLVKQQTLSEVMAKLTELQTSLNKISQKAELAIGVASLVDGVKNIYKGFKGLRSFSGIAKLRKSLGISKTKNIATLTGTVGNDVVQTISVSGKSTRAGTVGPGAERFFKTFTVGHARNFDSEVKILEDFASKYSGNKSISGNLKLVSERSFCASCSSVIKQFRAMFPNVTVELVNGVSK